MNAFPAPEVIVLAGGLGTRLRDVVPDLPKPMAPIAGQPFLKYLLTSLERHGFTRAVLSLGYRANEVRNYFGDRLDNLHLAYCVEEQPLGTGGAIRAAARLASGDHVFVVNGDTFASVDYAAMSAQHLSQRDVLTVALMHVADTARYGAVESVATRIKSFTEKDSSGEGYMNAGVYLLKRDILECLNLPERFSFEQEVLRLRIQQLHPAAFFASGYFIDIGVPEDYARAQHELHAKLDLNSQP
jgi:D-glycero-alpha-D-manno-heptose 1-phosphate guanylyltransferase